MCGICIVLKFQPLSKVDKELTSEKCQISQLEMRKLLEESLLSSLLHHRGPDIQRIVDHQLSATVHATACGCTLHFRGCLTPQPLEDTAGNSLLWNGEIFGGINVSQENDGAALLHLLQKCISTSDILSLVAKIRGPWALIYYQERTKTLWFGRDVFGRRSLLAHIDTKGGTLALSSVQLMHLKHWIELPARGLYSMPCNGTHDSLLSEQITLYPWLPNPGHSNCNVISNHNFKEHESLVFGDDTKITLVHGEYGIILGITAFNCALEPPSVIVNSDGEDRMKAVLDEQNDTKTPDKRTKHDNDTLLVAGAKSPDVAVLTDTIALKDKLGDNTDSKEIMAVASIDHIRLADQLLSILGEAVKVRVQEQAPNCDRCIQQRIRAYKSMRRRQSVMAAGIDTEMEVGDQTSGLGSSEDGGMCADWEASQSSITCSHARTAVLFSGGIDSLVLAALADRFVPVEEPIDLINVAFEQRTVPLVKQKKSDVTERHKRVQQTSQPRDPYNVPDRVTGRDGVQLLNPARQWNFIEVNVTADELQHARENRVQHLVYPLQTVLDDSIGCAIWFAARGIGKHTVYGSKSELNQQMGDVNLISDQDASNDTPYTSTARVVLVGMGADEQLAGYSRHRVKYNASGLAGLVDEIKMEIDRISSRNLGRDDRIISDHGKESRFPFLDESVVSFLNELPVWNKADLRQPRGIGEKLLLRVAAVKLGLAKAATLPKRAIQFGSRIAKMENRKEKASDTCSRLHKA